ncbi:MAG: GIY-YIG nuclease family protein [Gammaproteobacteria bacterium]
MGDKNKDALLGFIGKLEDTIEGATNWLANAGWDDSAKAVAEDKKPQQAARLSLAGKMGVENTAEKAEGDDKTLSVFAALPFFAGVSGFVVWFFAEISTGWGILLLLCSGFMVLYGWALWWSTEDINEAAIHAVRYRHKADETVAQAYRELSAAIGTIRENVAEIERNHEKELEEVKAAGGRLSVEMWREMKARDSEAAAKYERLQNEKGQVESENEKLTFDLQGAKVTLEYYADNARLEVYSGKQALRECGGIYVIKNTGDGKVKIGITDDNFKRRFGEIQSHCASAGIKKEDVIPEILVPLDEGLREVEQAIHRALGKSRTAGEWFGITPEKAVAIVLAHVHEKRVSNFKARTKLPIGESGGNDDSA